MRRPALRGLVCLTLVCVALAQASLSFAEDEMAYYDRPLGNPRQSRSVVVAKHGIVATSLPLAAEVGVDILKAGGNAADAAIATNAMLGLIEPMSCGIGGDVFVIYWDNKTKKLYGLNGSGRSPYTLNRDVFKQKGLKSIPGEGVLCWSVPGCVDGWEDAAGALRQQAAGRDSRPGDRLRRERLPGQPRSSPATGRAAHEGCRSIPTRPRPI